MTDHKAEWVERMLGACVPGGSYCDPQRVADAIREYYAVRAAAPAASEGEDGAVGGLRGIIGSMRNFASVADGCTITEVTNAPAAIRAWADMLEELRTRPAASEGEDGAVAWMVTGGGPASVLHRHYGSAQTDLRNRNSGAAIWPLYLRPAAQVAATPKHDEGREALPELPQPVPMGVDQDSTMRTIRREGYTAEQMRDYARAALATQPAARRVTELEVQVIRDAAEVLAAVGASGEKLPDNWRWPLIDELGGIAALMESFAQPAEGVSGG